MPDLILDTPDGIEMFRLLSIHGRLKLEMKGLRFRISTFAAVRRELGLTSRVPRDKVLAAWEEKMRAHGWVPLEEAHDEDDYASLADEMNDPDVDPWDENDWDPISVGNAKRYAEREGLPWPPRTGDFDRWYEKKNNS